jgi:hypothetical protein
MKTSKITQKSAGLGHTILEFPAGQTPDTPPEQAQPAATLDLLKHLPEGEFKTYVGDVAKMCYIHPSTTLLVSLGIVSGVACRAFALQYPDGEILPSSEYVMAGGFPGDGKSRLLKTFQRPIFQAQKAALKDYRRHETEFKEDPANEGKKFKEPYPANIFLTDTTVEALEPVLKESNGYFALASAEQAVVNTLIGASYGGEGRKNNNDLPLKGFNGEHHSSSRTSRDGYTGIVVGSITCFAQPVAIETILGKSEGSGLAERFLLVAEPTQQGGRKWTQRYYPNQYSQNVYNRIVGDLARLALESSNDFEDLPSYRLSAADWQRIDELREFELEPHLLDGGKYSTATMRGIVSKIDIHIMKISALLSCLYDKPIGVIESQFVDAAIGIMLDMLEYTLSLLFKVGVIGFDAEEDCIIAYLGDKKAATRRQVQQARHRNKPFSESVKPSTAINQTIERLIQKGVVGESEEFDATGNSKGKLLRMIA